MTLSSVRMLRDLTFGLTSCLVAACGQPLLAQMPSGLVVKSELAPDAQTKRGVLAVTDTGGHLFAHGELSPRGGGVGSYGSRRIPAWVHVTWREGNFVQEFKTAGWQGGTIVGDYRVEVASRIPRETLRHASSGNERALRVIFRLKDDGVALAWDVQEVKYHPSGGSGYVYSMRGGDF